VAVSPDGRLIATGCADGTAWFWETATGKSVGPPLVHRQDVVDLTFDPSGKMLATASWDGKARLWLAPEPISGEAAQVKLLVQVATGIELDSGGAAVVLSAKEWQKRKEQLKQLPAP
jgi:WD40 repeat protein